MLIDQALDDLRTITGFDGRTAGLDEIYVQRVAIRTSPEVVLERP